jgi:phosphatidylinositol alpha-1,6-mannosyltransferase
VASPPQRFDHRDFFGDVVVAQSEWTRRRIEQAFQDAGRPAPHLEVIPPPVGPVSEPSESDVARVRAELRLSSDRPVFVYPGDLEVGRGAERVAAAVPFLASLVPGAVVVFACRHKTPRAPAIEAELRARLEPESVRFAREVDLAALLRASRAVLFPVDDLRGKVDLPISLLEAMRLRVPVVTVREGPLADLEGTLRVELEDPRGLAEAAAALTSGDARENTISRALAEVSRKYDSRVVAEAYERLYGSLLRS